MAHFATMALLRTTCLLLVFLQLFNLTLARIGFKKDQRVDWEFPPLFKDKSYTGIPQGHLRPLGWQARPEGRLPEIRKFPTPQEFEIKFVKPARAVVMKGVMTQVPAMANWAKDDYLKTHYAALDVHVTVKKEFLSKGNRKTKMKKFLKEYHYEDWYLSNIVPTPMMKELILPKPLLCGVARRSLLESEIWMSSGGTSSLLHSHADHDLHCLLSGRKDFILIDYKHRENFAWVDKEAQPGAGHSPMNVDQVNVFSYPGVTNTPWKWATLNAGDCIYIPAGHIHQVRSFGRSFSSTILWAPIPESNFSDCKGINMNTAQPLSDAHFLWSYTHGDRHVTDEELNSETLRRHMVILMRNESHLQFGVFREFYNEVMSEINDYPDVEKVWALMDTDNKKQLSREFIPQIAANILDQVAATLNKAHDGHRVKQFQGFKKEEL